MTTVVDRAIENLIDWKPSFLVCLGPGDYRECIVVKKAESLTEKSSYMYLVRFSDATEAWVDLSRGYKISNSFDPDSTNKYGML